MLSPSLCLPRLVPRRAVLRRAARVLSGVAQAALFAAVLALLVAGPGFLSDQASTAKAPRTAVARR